MPSSYTATIPKYFPDLTSAQEEKLQMLIQVYSQINQRVNIISRKDMQNFYERHVLHSLAIAKIVHFQAGTNVADIGTGGGFPGIPLAIFFPDVIFYLIDSAAKKISVVEHIMRKLQLANVKTYCTRAEELATNFDFVISRAVAPAKVICRWTLHSISAYSYNALENGYFLLKGGDLVKELAVFSSGYQTFDISSFFEEFFFKSKKIVYIPKAIAEAKMNIPWTAK